MFACLLGNGVIIATFYPKYGGYKKGRTIGGSNFAYGRLKILLAISDIFLAVSTYPVIMYYAITENLFGPPNAGHLLRHARLSQEYYWVYITGSLMVFSQSVSAGLICLITTERFTALGKFKIRIIDDLRHS